MDDFDHQVEMLDEKQNPNPKVMEHHFTKPDNEPFGMMVRASKKGKGCYVVEVE